MVLQDRTSLKIIGNSKYIRVPYPVAIDNKFPFDDMDKLNLKIEGKKIVIEKNAGDKE